MDLFSVLTLAGGIALFLFGMNYMGDNLKKLSGSSLETILEKLTSNRIKGFFLGLFVTAVIQSSSAVMVMLVGFVNSGIMKLAQTTSILMGAGIGTTVTAWLLSTSGISGTSFVLKLLKPSSFTPILAVIGIIMAMAAKSEKKKNIGAIFIGFAILMFGMETMSGATKGLQSNDAFTTMLVMFQNPFMGILVGTIFTAVIQSSSASIGILQALSLSGTIPLSTAIPVILGMNIGTTVSPVLSALNGNANAKRVAASGVSIKAIGVAIVAIVFYTAHSFFKFPFMFENANVFSIALVHTGYNVIATLILLPFSHGIEKLSMLIIKEKVSEEDNIFASLDERFLQFPEFAVERSRELIGQMAELSQRTFNAAICLSYDFSEEVAQKIKKQERLVDKYEDKLTAYLVKLISVKNTFKESNEVTMLIHVIGDIERISDYAYGLVKQARVIHEKGIVFSEVAQRELDEIAQSINDMLSLAVESVQKNDREIAKKIGPMKKEIDKMISDTKSNHIERFETGLCASNASFAYLDLLTAIGHISNHCSNLAIYLRQKNDRPIQLHKKKNKA